MKNGKASGADGISAELLKVKESLTPAILLKIYHEIWISEKMPEEWKNSLIRTCLTAALEKDVRKKQAGFRKGRSCSDHIFTLRQIFEEAKEWNSTVYANFLDVEKAFNSIHTEAYYGASCDAIEYDLR